MRVCANLNVLSFASQRFVAKLYPDVGHVCLLDVVAAVCVLETQELRLAEHMWRGPHVLTLGITILCLHDFIEGCIKCPLTMVTAIESGCRFIMVHYMTSDMPFKGAEAMSAPFWKACARCGF